jgi:D-alanyl-D-alanine carboxypeptidase/D-alanyl-D-alanine-endopeptidase (penicillin-binding protein 4)
MNKKNYILLLIFLLIQSFPFAQGSNNLVTQLDSLLSSDYFKSTQISLDIFDLTNETYLFRKNEKLLMRPASNMKILTTSASLFFLNEYTFETKIYFSGEVDDSVCSEDIYVVGALDPDFSLKDLEQIVIEIKKYGINEIRGNIYADISAIDSLYRGEGWMWDDDPYQYAAHLSALNINDNCVDVIYSPSEIGKPAKIELHPNTNYVELVNHSVTIENGETDISITRDWMNRSNRIIVKGNISINDKPNTEQINVENPSRYFIHLLKEQVKSYGIKFNGEIGFRVLKEDAEEIFSFERELDSVLVNTNKVSDNLSAEMLLRVLALNYYGKPASAINGIKLIDSLITTINLDPKLFRFADGSGMSFYNLVSSELIIEILKYFYYNEEELFVKLYNSFPISGYDGTLKRRMLESNAFRKVHAKTGTISGVSNLSGYMTNKENHLIAFSILVQNFSGSAKAARDFQDKICELIYNN